ncbi:hydantoinase/oxoprolinase family protein [Amycolatopsis jejuensis]|uniref:hydantoinase/oxoprolinase family protein n=1 Tax=Amycolatopsis jejuensis TaxID=330084 RepID=UPI000524535C|nr:hydantoinase/oxoprolinase family protein [Amycolatopsis jejuensis]
MAIRFSVDVGGTFSDLVVADGASGRTAVAKGPSTPQAAEDGVLALVGSALPAEQLSEADLFLHGTTVGLNTVLERTGDPVGLITTEGFRDVLEVRRGTRAEMLALQWSPPEPLVPRRLRREVRERVLSDGSVDTPLDGDAVRDAVAVFRAEGVDAVAVALINSYVNPAHELEIERLLRAEGFTGQVSLSHQVAREYREYERTSTTVIDGYVRRRVAGYLGRLEAGLRDKGFRGTALVARSGGGVMTFAAAAQRPVETMMSGPAAGAVGAGVLAAELGYRSGVAIDVGGTSFDTSLITDGVPAVRFLGEVDGHPIKTSWVDVRSIGAGGGSLAHVDAGGLVRVGPRSAGASPGPAAYGRGGTQATVTDAAAHLGMLGFGELAGDLTLDFAAAQSALADIGAKASLDTGDAAAGIMRIAAAMMAGAIRQVTLEEGVDPRELPLVAYGGAGPLFATLLAAELEMDTIIVPRSAGNFSALGLLMQDVVSEAAQTAAGPLTAEHLEKLAAIGDELFAELAAGPEDGSSLIRETTVELRYAGQEHTLSVPVDLLRPVVPALDDLRSEFTGQHRRSFGYDLGETPLEAVTVRARTRIVLDRPEPAEEPAAATGGEPRTRDAYSFEQDCWTRFRVLEHDRLGDGPVAGPAIVTENTTTTYLDHGWSARREPGGSLVLTRKAANR